MRTRPAQLFAFLASFLIQLQLLGKKIMGRFLTNKIRYLISLLIFTVYLVNPSLVAADFLKVTAPAEIYLDTSFEISLEILAQANTKYFVKARLGSSPSNMRSGQTLNETKNVWLSDTVSWETFPSFETNDSGLWVGRIYAKASKKAVLGSNFLVIRIHAQNNSNIDSAAYSLTVKEFPKAEIKSQTLTIVEEKGEPILNEFLPQPLSGNKEWVEIKNKGNGKSDLSGWKVDDQSGKSSAQIIPTGTIIAPGGFLVVTFTSPKLNDLADSVRLLKPDDTVVESYTYSNSVKDQSFSKDSRGNWFLTANTSPGTQNPIVLKQVSSTPTNSNKQTSLDNPQNTSTEPSSVGQNTITNELPEVLGNQDKKFATVSSSFTKKKTGNSVTFTLVVIGSLLVAGSGVFLIKNKVKSGQSENSDQPL